MNILNKLFQKFLKQRAGTESLQKGNIMNTKHVFLDVDGTLVNFKGEIPRSTLEAISKAQSNGHKMILATGRQRSQIYPWLLEKVNFDGILASSSAYIEIDGRAIFESRPTKQKLVQLIDFFDEHGIVYFAQSKDMIYGTEKCLGPILKAVEESDNAFFKSIFKNSMIVDDPKSLDCIEKIAYEQSPFSLEELRKILGDYYYIVSYSSGDIGDKSQGEITFEGINKAKGIERYMAYLGADIKDSIAIGDSENDLEMIKAAGIGVAMGNGSDEVKTAADMVTDHIDDDGIYKAFVKLGLI